MCSPRLFLALCFRLARVERLSFLRPFCCAIRALDPTPHRLNLLHHEPNQPRLP